LDGIQMQFCALRAQGVPLRQCCEELGLHLYQATNWMYRRRAVSKLIDAQVEEFREELKKDALDKATQSITLRREFLDKHFIAVTRKVVAPKKINAGAAADWFEVGYKAIGAIQPTQNTNIANASATAAVQALNTAQTRAFIPSWRKQTLKEITEQNATVGDRRPAEPAELPAGK
jgi:hypothetical protein